MYEKRNLGQEELQYVYDTAQRRMDAHPYLAAEYKKMIDDYAFYQNRDEAVKAAKELNRENVRKYQVWARVSKKEERYYIENYYIVSNDWKILMAAEYIGMEQIFFE